MKLEMKRDNVVNLVLLLIPYSILWVLAVIVMLGDRSEASKAMVLLVGFYPQIFIISFPWCLIGFFGYFFFPLIPVSLFLGMIINIVIMSSRETGIAYWFFFVVAGVSIPWLAVGALIK